MTTDKEIRLPYYTRDKDGDELLINRSGQLEGYDAAWIRCTTQGGAAASVFVVQEKVERVCRAMYLAAGMEWPGVHENCHGEVCVKSEPTACLTQFREGPCTGTRGHPGDCTVNADDIPVPARPVHWCGASLPTTKSKGPAICADVIGHSGDHGAMWWPKGHAVPEEVTTGHARPAVPLADLQRRVENLEQTSASGAAVDDILADFRSALGEVEERMTTLEGKFTARGPADMDSITRTNHRVEIIQLLAEIRDRLPEPPAPECGSQRPGSSPAEFCSETGEHTRHRHGTSTWPFQCESVNGDLACYHSRGHLGMHQRGTTSW